MARVVRVAGLIRSGGEEQCHGGGRGGALDGEKGYLPDRPGVGGLENA